MKTRLAFVILGFMFLIVPFVHAPKLVETQPVTSHTYGNTWEEVCEGGSCRRTLYSGIRYVEEGGEWVKIEEAQDILAYYRLVYIEQDADYEIELETANWTHLKKLKIKSDQQGLIEFKINNSVFSVEFFEEGGEELELEDVFIGHLPFTNITVGNSSTTIQLQDANSENLEDTRTTNQSGFANSNFGSRADLEATALYSVEAFIKFNLSDVTGSQIEEALLGGYCHSCGNPGNLYVFHVLNQTWLENLVTHNDQPCGSGFDDWSQCNLTIGNYTSPPDNVWTIWDVTPGVRNSSKRGDENVSFAFNATYQHFWRSKEYTTVSQRPYLNITYEPSATNYTSLSTNVTNYTIITEADDIKVTALWQANTSQNMSHAWIYSNETGSFANSNYLSLGVNSNTNWSNISFSPSGFGKGLFAVAIKANDTSAAENTTGYWFWEIPTPFNVTPDNKSLTLNVSDFDDFNITVKNTGHLPGMYNLTCKQGALCNGTNFTITYSHSDFEVGSGLNQTVLVNVTSAAGLSQQLYLGNLSVKSVNTTEEVNFTLRVNITQGAFGVADLINTSISKTQINTQNATIIFLVNNTGGASLTCSAYTSTSPSIPKTTFNDTAFTLAANTPRWITMWTGKPATGVYYGSLVLDCGSSTDSATLILDSNDPAADPPGGGGGTTFQIIGDFNMTTIPTVFAQDISPGMRLARDLTILNPNAVDTEVTIRFVCSDDESCNWFTSEEAVVTVPGGNEWSPGREHFKIIVEAPENAEFGEYQTSIHLESPTGTMLIPYRLVVTQFSISLLANQILTIINDNILIVGIAGFLVLVFFRRRRK